MPFAIVAVPFDSYASIPTAQDRWLLVCLSRYADRAGRCWPGMRTLAVDARMSLASVSRHLASLEGLGVFQRERKPGKVYVYQLAPAYCPQWPSERRVAVQEGRQDQSHKPGNSRNDSAEEQNPVKRSHVPSLEHLAPAYCPQWPSSRPASAVQPGAYEKHNRPRDKDPAQDFHVSSLEHRVPQRGTEARPYKHLESEMVQWRARMAAWQRSGGKVWAVNAGPRPTEPGCWVPRELLIAG